MSHNNAGFGEFFAASWDPCLRAVAACTGNMTLAEDQTAEAFARAWASWPKVSRHPAPRAWVVRTALNAGASWWRRRSKETALTSQDIAAAALALGLTGVHGAAPPLGTGTIAPSVSSTATIRTAAFTLTRNADGTDTLTLTNGQLLDPAALQRALAQAGIRALVKIGTTCSSHPPAPDPGRLGVLSVRPPVWPPRPATPLPGNLKPGDLNRIIDHTKTVINPAAMPSGTELFFGYFNSDHAIFFDLIYAGSYTCSTGQPPAAP